MSIYEPQARTTTDESANLVDCQPQDLDPVLCFLSGMSDVDLPEPKWGPIGREVFARTYAREVTDPDGLPRKETWAETVRRVVLGSMHSVPQEHWLPTEPVDLFNLIYNFRAVPAGRHLWVTGTQVKGFSRNCWAAGWGPRLSDHFGFLASRLFEGGGVGANYSSDLISVTPPVAGRLDVRFACPDDHPDATRVKGVVGERLTGAVATGGRTWSPLTLGAITSGTVHTTGTIKVHDSREGWVDTWCDLIDMASVPGEHTVVIDLSGLRPSGTPLKTFGGRASGPAALAESIVTITEILSRVAAGTAPRRLSGLEAMEIDHAIAGAIVAGGSRRSARISLMSWDDEHIFDFIDAKKDAMAHWSTNISVEIDSWFHRALDHQNDPRHDQAVQVLQRVAAGMAHNGEPGFVDTERHSVDEPRPIRNVNPCLTGDTRILTRDGLQAIASLAGTTFEIWNGSQWSRSTAWSTGVKPVYRVTLSDGRQITATADHRFAVSDGSVVAVDDLIVGDSTLSTFCASGWDGGASPFSTREATLLGYLQGDGTRRRDCGAVSSKNNEPEIAELLSEFGFERVGDAWYAGADSPAAHLVQKAEMLDDHLPDRSLPEWLFSATQETVTAFLRGLYSANGAALSTQRRVTLKSTCRQLVSEVQMLLSAMGIRSYVTTNRPATIEWANGTYMSRESHDLNIAAWRGIERFRRTIGFIHDHKTAIAQGYVAPSWERAAYDSAVVSIEQLGEVEVYDFHEPLRHWGWANGIQTHNCGEASLSTHSIVGSGPDFPAAGESCNLGSIDLASFGTDTEGAHKAFELMARFLYRATMVTHPDPAAMSIEPVNRRIGVGIMGLQGWAAAYGVKLSDLATGTTNTVILSGLLRNFRLTARRAANALADELGCPRPVKVTAVAPTGTIAQLSGTTPGIHPVFARHFIRRVRFSRNDPDLSTLAALGHRIEDDVYASDTKVVEFVVRDSILDRHPATLIEQSDEIPVEKFLDLIAFVQRHFCGDGDGQAVSATAHVHEDTDAAWLAKVIHDRLGTLKGFTVFPAVSRPQPPYTAISEAEYLAAKADRRGVVSVGDSNSGECAGGACPVR